MIRRYTWLFLTLLALYVVLAFSLPTDPDVLSRYDMTQAEARLLSLAVVVPLVLIYLVALYGFIRFYKYTKSVQGSKESRGLYLMADGLGILAMSLPVGSVFSSTSSFIAHRYPTWGSETVFIRTYVALVFAVAALYYLSLGVQKLSDTLKFNRPTSIPIISYLGPIIIACVFTWLVTSRNTNSGTAGTSVFPDWLYIISLVIPYSFAWSIGLRAVFQLYDYQKRTRGILYKQALRYVSVGVGVLIGTSVFIQLITAMSEQLNRLDLTPLLTVIYFLILLYVVGYGLVARGANKLKQIEEA